MHPLWESCWIASRTRTFLVSSDYSSKMCMVVCRPAFTIHNRFNCLCPQKMQQMHTCSDCMACKCLQHCQAVFIAVVMPFITSGRQSDHGWGLELVDVSPGSSKLIIQKIEVQDRQGLVGEAPGLEPGMVVSAWNPDESWAHDALLRVNATKGVPAAELTVWSLVDVMVHPLGVHIHQQVANSLWVSQHCLTLCQLLCRMPAHMCSSVTMSPMCMQICFLSICVISKLGISRLLLLRAYIKEELVGNSLCLRRSLITVGMLM